MKLSVVVPVYNTVEYLQQCIESILAQTYKDMEIILVDDGSTDGSGEMCDEYAKNNSNICVIHQKNSGSTEARRIGLQEARGDYVTFMDSDDWLDEEAYESLMEKAITEKCEIVSLGGYVVCDGSNYRNVQDATLFGTYTKDNKLDVFLSKMMYDDEKEKRGITPSLAGKVIRRDIISIAMQDIDCNISKGDDAAVFYPCCLLAEKICILDEYKYYYRCRSGSISHHNDISCFNKVYAFYRYLENRFKKEDEKNRLLNQLSKYLGYFLIGAMKEVYGFQIKRTYLFPYRCIEKDSKIILYGAGKVGQSYYEQIKKSGYCDIVAWADKEAYDSKLISPEQIIELDYSIIVIAVKNKECADEIKDNLLGLGCEKEKIVWAEPVEMALV